MTVAIDKGRGHPARWVTFNAVGIVGIGVQLGALIALTEWLGLHCLFSTGIAVEAAIVHNFVWHEYWTWRDLSIRDGRGRWTRFARFNLLNGLVSIGGQLLFTGLYAKTFGMHYAAANLLAIATGSLVNFVVNDRLVFRRSRRPSRSVGAAALGTFVLGCTFGATAAASELKPHTVTAWADYVDATEQRIRREQTSGHGFLALDFREDAARVRALAERGNVRVVQMTTRGADDLRIDIPNGEFHHWRGSIFVPSATLDEVLLELRRPLTGRDLQPDVLESRVLARKGPWSRVFLKLRRKKIVTVHYNTEHEVEYTRHDTRRASSQSVATRIAELDRAETPLETEKPIGHDRGFLWRLNSYWRYEETDRGVIIECESISLSRSIPSAVRWMVAPLIERAARESMERTLTSMRTRLLSSVASSQPQPD